MLKKIFEYPSKLRFFFPLKFCGNRSGPLEMLGNIEFWNHLPKLTRERNAWNLKQTRETFVPTQKTISKGTSINQSINQSIRLYLSRVARDSYNTDKLVALFHQICPLYILKISYIYIYIYIYIYKRALN